MLSGLEELLVFGFVPLMIGMLGVPDPSGKAATTVSGRMKLPHPMPPATKAVATVELVEQRHGRAIEPAVARQTIGWRGSRSRKFAVGFDPSRVKPTTCYAVRAQLACDGAVRFRTLHPSPVMPGSGDPITIDLTPCAD